VRALIATVAAVLLLAAVALAGDTSPQPVIAYTQFRTLAHVHLYVTGPGGTREIGHGQVPSVAPDGRMVTGSALGSRGPALTVYEMAGGRSHSFFSDRVIALPLAWSRDSRYLAVLLETPRRISSTGLAVVDTKTMTARTVATGLIEGASFAPSGPDRLVYGYEAQSEPVKDRVANLYTVNPGGSGRTQLTTDGISFQPLWTAKGIVYDRETRRGAGRSPAYQLWLLHGGHSTQVTSRASVVAIVPRAASANGNRLIADFEGLGVGVSSPLAISAVTTPGPRARHRRHSRAGGRDLTGRPDPAARARGLHAPAI
jgi:hypothetical protein